MVAGFSPKDSPISEDKFGISAFNFHISKDNSLLLILRYFTEHNQRKLPSQSTRARRKITDGERKT